MTKRQQSRNAMSTAREPSNLAIAQKPTRPARSDDELGRMREAHERQERRHVPVAARFETNPDGSADLGSPHDDVRGWVIRLKDAFGSGSDDFALAQLRHLVQMMPERETAPAKNLNSMLAAVDGVRPETEAEGALAVQMAATHHLAMKCLSGASTATTFQAREANGNLATKMLRTYTTQLEALAKLRRGGEQKVVVEHVHVYQGGQAIVGSVAATGGRGQGENGQQPHVPADPRALALATGAALLCEDEGRDRMPSASRERQEPLPEARRSGRKRRAQG